MNTSKRGGNGGVTCNHVTSLNSTCLHVSLYPPQGGGLSAPLLSFMSPLILCKRVVHCVQSPFWASVVAHVQCCACTGTALQSSPAHHAWDWGSRRDVQQSCPRFLVEQTPLWPPAWSPTRASAVPHLRCRASVHRHSFAGHASAPCRDLVQTCSATVLPVSHKEEVAL